MKPLEDTAIKAAIVRGAEIYFAECRGRVETFIGDHFRYPGAWRTNRQALGLDLLRAPLNLIWAPVYVLSRVLIYACRRGGLKRLAAMFDRLPSGFTTSVQRYLAQVTYSQLLQRPSAEGQPDRLHDCIAEALRETTDTEPDHQPLTRAAIEALIDDALRQYSITRTASADITNSLFTTLTGAFALQKFTPGAFAVGFAVAALVANQLAASDFILGQSLGQLYYSLFPATPTLTVKLGSVTAIMTLLAVFASFSGLLTDPVQSRLGLHRKRLNKMIDHLESDFKAQTLGSFRPRDQYLARVLEVVDAAKSTLG